MYYANERKNVFLLFLALFLLSMAQAQQQMPSPKDKAVELLKKNILATGLNQSLLNAYRVTDAYPDKKSGGFLVYLQQVHMGIPVYNKIGVYIFKDSVLLQKRPDFINKIPGGQLARTANYSITPAQAIHFAAAHLSIPLQDEPRLLRKDASSNRFVYTPAGMGVDSITSELVWLPVNDNKEIKLCWNVRMASPDGKDDWFVRIDAQTGDYLEKNSLVVTERTTDECAPVTDKRVQQPVLQLQPVASLTDAGKTFSPPPAVSSASYRVYPYPVESPNFGAQVLETDPWLKAGAGNNAVTLGWHFDNASNYSSTRGNNVWAQEDIAGTSVTTGFTDNSSTGTPVLTFDNTINPTINPVVGVNLKAGIDNLFYWNNIMHDISYQYGFDEGAGNFQSNNLGRGGLGSDYVNAFADDGAGLNNANFGTPPDGQNPRMRMYDWNLGVSTNLAISAPGAIAGNYIAVESAINLASQLGTNGGSKTGNIVLLNDAGATHLGCAVVQNAAALVNNIALIDRGTCGFTTKIKAAQNAGAIAVIIINNTASAPSVIGAASGDPLIPTITIPAVMISLTDGNTLKANLTGLNGSMTESGLFVDGSIDNGVISHEYTHGISNRLTGGPANVGCLVNQEQMGEGWSDYMALMVTTNWATAGIGDGVNKRPIGTYAFSQTATGSGIRTFPYSTNMTINPWTYGMMATNTAGEVHTIGEIWCATVWDMTWNIIQQEGIDPDIYHGTKGNNIALQLVLQGMKYQPCSPGFLDARDAILKADSILYNYAHKCAIWNAFARRGMGKSASQGSAAIYTDQVQAFDLPAGLGVANTVNKTTILNGDNITYTIKAYCDCSVLSNISITDTLSNNLTYVSSPGGSYTAPYVHFDNIGFAPGETKTFTIQATVTGTYTAPVTLINDSRDPANYSWTAAAATGSTNWVEVTTRSHSTSHAFFAADQPTATDFTLTSGDVLLDSIATLSFWHYFETEPSFDGGVVEMSTDAGATWKDLGPYMTQNGYNSSFDPSVGVLGGRKAFSGSSGGVFIQTIISLTDFKGVTARIRFRASSDAAAAAEGWYIDDITLQNQKGIVNKSYAFNGATTLSKSNILSLFTASALPVNFISFEAQKINKTAALHWVVAQEVNTDKYTIERSADGRSFSAVGEIPHSNMPGAVKDYYFTDNGVLPGDNYYRIAEKDLDGKTTLSVTKVLRFDNTDLSVRLLPVPTYNHQVQLEITGGTTSTFTASLINTVGQLIKMYPVKAGNNLIDLKNFASGVYYLKIQTNNGHTELRKLVIE